MTTDTAGYFGASSSEHLALLTYAACLIRIHGKRVLAFKTVGRWWTAVTIIHLILTTCALNSIQEVACETFRTNRLTRTFLTISKPRIAWQTFIQRVQTVTNSATQTLDFFLASDAIRKHSYTLFALPVIGIEVILALGALEAVAQNGAVRLVVFDWSERVVVCVAIRNFVLFCVITTNRYWYRPHQCSPSIL